MIHERPSFLLGEHFRRNTGGRSNGWRFTTLRTTRILLDVAIPHAISFRDRNGIEWMRLAPTACGKTQMTIAALYSWDGATWVPDLCLFLETLYHDVCCQFLNTEHFPFSKRECDDGFLDLMKLSKFKLRYLYWQGVRKLGWAFLRDNGEWSKVLTTANPKAA